MASPGVIAPDAQAHLKKALALLLYHQPAEPLTFLADYFNGLSSSSARLAQAAQMLRRDLATGPLTTEAAARAFTALTHAGPPSVDGAAANSLLDRIASTLPERIAENVHGLKVGNGIRLSLSDFLRLLEAVQAAASMTDSDGQGILS